MAAAAGKPPRRPVKGQGCSSAMPDAASGVLARTVGFHIARAAVVAYAAFDEHIGQPHDLRKVDFSLLMLLQEQGPMAPKRLVRLLALTPPKLSMVMERLQQRELIRREPDPADRRSVRASLTAQGRALVQSLVPVARTMEQELLKRLSVAEHAQLIGLLDKLAGIEAPAEI